MAIKKTASELRELAMQLIEKAKAAEREEKVAAKQMEEKFALKLGHLVLGYYKAGFTGFDKGDFKKKVAEIVASGQGTQDKADAAADDKKGDEAKDPAEEPAGDTADEVDAATEEVSALTDGGGNADKPTQSSGIRSFFGGNQQ